MPTCKVRNIVSKHEGPIDKVETNAISANDVETKDPNCEPCDTDNLIDAPLPFPGEDGAHDTNFEIDVPTSGDTATLSEYVAS